MKKMTDNEIIKALECCVNDICEEYPYREDECIDNLNEENKMLKDTLNLINRQKAEIERLKDEVSQLKIHLMAIESTANLYKKNHDVLERALQFQKLKNEAIKSEARKELVNLIKRRLNSNTSRGAYLINIVDNLLNEMEREENA